MNTASFGEVQNSSKEKLAASKNLYKLADNEDRADSELHVPSRASRSASFSDESADGIELTTRTP